MKSKLTQNEKNMIETQKKMIDAFEKSGVGDMLRSRHKAHLEEINKASKIPPIIPIKNLTPTDKRIRKAEELLYEFTFNKKNADVEDVLKALEIVGKSRVKDDTKPKTGHYTGASFKQAQKFISISKSYEKLKETKTPTRAKNILMKKYNISLSTLTRYITNGNRLRKK